MAKNMRRGNLQKVLRGVKIPHAFFYRLESIWFILVCIPDEIERNNGFRLWPTSLRDTRLDARFQVLHENKKTGQDLFRGSILQH